MCAMGIAALSKYLYKIIDVEKLKELTKATDGIVSKK
jgi:hypothetical protein